MARRRSKPVHPDHADCPPNLAATGPGKGARIRAKACRAGAELGVLLGADPEAVRALVGTDPEAVRRRIAQDLLAPAIKALGDGLRWRSRSGAPRASIIQTYLRLARLVDIERDVAVLVLDRLGVPIDRAKLAVETLSQLEAMDAHQRALLLRDELIEYNRAHPEQPVLDFRLVPGALGNGASLAVQGPTGPGMAPASSAAPKAPGRGVSGGFEILDAEEVEP